MSFLSTTDYSDLCFISKKLGDTFDFVQGAGGNTSVKLPNTLLVKASGKELKHCAFKNIFVEVDSSKLVSNINSILTSSTEIHEIFISNDEGLKPSMEVYLHALLDKKFVVHTHPIKLLAEMAAGRFIKPTSSSIKYKIIPYAKPGLPLVKAVHNAISEDKINDINVLFLQNHGIVVAADTAQEVLELHADVLEETCGQNFLNNKNFVIDQDKYNCYFKELQKVIDVPLFKPKNIEIHQLACDNNLLSKVIQGPLYPDHVVFCGKKQEVLEQTFDKTKISQLIKQKKLSHLLVKNVGVILLDKKDILEVMLLTQLNVLLETEGSTQLSVLTTANCDDLLMCKMEQHRISQN